MDHEPLRAWVPRGLDDTGVAAGGCATAYADQDRVWRAAWNESGRVSSRSQCDLEHHLLILTVSLVSELGVLALAIGFLASYAILAIAHPPGWCSSNLMSPQAATSIKPRAC